MQSKLSKNRKGAVKMKKILAVVIGLVIVVALVGPFGSGYIVESRVTKLLDSLKESLPANSVKYGKLQRGWFGSDIKVSIKDKSIAFEAVLHISHGPVLLKKGSLIFGLGYIDIKVTDSKSKVTGLGAIKEILKQARIDIVLNYQSTVTVDATINKLVKPIEIEKIKVSQLNNFRFNVNIELENEIGKSLLAFDEIEIISGKTKVVVNQYDSAMTFLKSQKGASIGGTFAKIRSIMVNYNANGKSRKITLNGLHLKTNTQAASGKISQESLIKIESIAIPGEKLLSLKIPLSLRKLDEQQFARYEKLVSVSPLNVLELSKVITLLIAGEPEISMDKTTIKLGDKEATMTFMFKGVPLKKGDIVGIFNFRKVIYFKLVVDTPKTVLKDLVSLVNRLVNDFSNLNSAGSSMNASDDADGTIDRWISTKFITKSPTGYRLQLEIKDSKMSINGESHKSFLFP